MVLRSEAPMHTVGGYGYAVFIEPLNRNLIPRLLLVGTSG